MSPEEQGLFHNNLGSSPLAERLRPRSLHEMLLPPGLDSQLFEQWRSKVPSPPSLILWGPPGSGKTTLARALGAACKARFHEMSAVAAGVKDVRTIIQQAQNSLTPTLLFLDEVHRFNAAQQDVLLPWIERGTLSFIGATTENPTFSLNAALLSRCQVIHLTGFGEESLIPLLRRACEEENISVSPQEEALLLRAAQGDARALLRTIEEYTRAKEHFSSVEAYLQQTPHILYDRSGDQHFDTVSAFIKSMRAGDLDSALYFGFRMIKAGEDPRYLLRRMIIFASEDIGNAEPQALV
ncbi:AAA family ATPase, partial [bacterium]|nr:AAA family ATPase [bacterium]